MKLTIQERIELRNELFQNFIYYKIFMKKSDNKNYYMLLFNI